LLQPETCHSVSGRLALKATSFSPAPPLPTFPATVGHDLRDLTRHECLLYRDPVIGRPFSWKFHRAGKVVAVKVSGKLNLNDLATKLTACAAGHGIAQTIEFGLTPLFVSGQLVQILLEWADERDPLYAFHPSRYLPPAKVCAFLDFLLASSGHLLRGEGANAPRQVRASNCHAKNVILGVPRQPRLDAEKNHI
jgi:DNA-binding transcriptional LysR family regulator